ncbi:MAG: CDP-diacylglycerol--serine O-phosphatidyltransferase [Bacteroidales bacterium]|jgi:CDP-diacylglycerol--serine O-phosphatidyltransferase|nr:CDP-diacylglycerol--serine O-phosphatidyltransferase [Bacteroidales bacterium]
MRKLIIGIPSFITSMNLVCGAIATIMALQGNVHTAIFLIILAAVFDFFDGFVARLLHASSEFGKQMDSLADVISFGFAPSVLLYNLILTNDILHGYFPLISILIVVFAALRLAKFNIDTEQTVEFRGLPTPAATLLIISICWYCNDYNNSITEFLTTNYVIIALIIGISALMVSRIRLFSLKIKSFSLKSNIWQIILIACAVVLLIIFKILGIGLTIILYIGLSILRQIIYKKVNI